MRKVIKKLELIIVSVVLCPLAVFGQSSEGPSYEDILSGFTDPSRWLTYSGDYSAVSYTHLTLPTKA